MVAAAASSHVVVQQGRHAAGALGGCQGAAVVACWLTACVGPVAVVQLVRVHARAAAAAATQEGGVTGQGSAGRGVVRSWLQCVG
jgi:hypothetical protein